MTLLVVFLAFVAVVAVAVVRWLATVVRQLNVVERSYMRPPRRRSH